MDPVTFLLSRKNLRSGYPRTFLSFWCVMVSIGTAHGNLEDDIILNIGAEIVRSYAPGNIADFAPRFAAVVGIDGGEGGGELS